jgi:hypothetical protein
METQGGSYQVVPGSCNAVWITNHWVVTCSVALQGCGTSVCAEQRSACVFDDPVRVVSTTQC